MLETSRGAVPRSAAKLQIVYEAHEARVQPGEFRRDIRRRVEQIINGHTENISELGELLRRQALLQFSYLGVVGVGIMVTHDPYSDNTQLQKRTRCF